MVTALKNFIENHIDLIENNDFTNLYIDAKEEIPFQIGNLTTNLMHAGINPLDHLNRVVPEMFSNSMINEIELPDNITKIKSQAFLDCFQLSSISIPVSVTEIHDTAFKGCYKLDQIVYEGTVEQWKDLNVSWATFIDCKAVVITCKDGEVSTGEAL